MLFRSVVRVGTGRKKLIEVALPLDAINGASVREGFIYRGNPSALHKWWAQRPLAAARAVIFAQMVDDPSSCPDLFPTEKAQEKERQRLFRIIEDLVQWENTTNEEVLQKARDEIWQSWRGGVPIRVEKRNGAFFRLVKSTTRRPPARAATGGTRHGQEYRSEERRVGKECRL